MSETVGRGVVRGSTVVLEQPVALPDGAEVVIRSDNGARRGSPKAILQALRSLPRVDAEAAEELMRQIGKGKMPVRYRNPLLVSRRTSCRGRPKPKKAG